MEVTTASLVCTNKDTALELMGESALINQNTPAHVPFSETELTKWASEGYFLAYIPSGSVASEFGNMIGRRVSARMPLQYRDLAVMSARGPAEWLVGKFTNEEERVALKVRYIAHLCISWNLHPFMRQYYKCHLKSSTSFGNGRPPVIISLNFQSALLHCKPLAHTLKLVGMTRSALPREE